MTSAIKGFKLEASEAMRVVDKLTSIDLKAATSAGEIAEGLAQFANLGSLSGVDIDQASAYVATIADVSQRSGASVGQALKTIISRFGNVKAGAFNKLNLDDENSDTTEKLNDVERVLSKLGISMRDTNLQFKDFDEVLDDIASRWETLDNVSKKAIANALAGVRQQESFVTLMENYDKYQTLLEASRNSAGTAETKYESYRDSLQAAMAGLTSAWEKLVNDAEINNLLKDLTHLLTEMVKFLPTLIKYLPSLLATLDNLKAFSGQSIWQKGGRYLKEVFVGSKGLFTGVSKTLTKFRKQETDAIAENIKFKRAETEATKQNTQAEQSETTANEGAAAAEAQETTANVASTTSEIAETTANEASAASTVKGGGKIGAILGGASILINQALTALSSLSTLGTTHDYKGESVETSKEAQKAGAGVGAIFSLIPFVGTFIGDAVANAITKSLDEERDSANYITTTSQKRLTNLQGLSSAIEDIGSEIGSQDSIKAADKFLADIYSSENEETRNLLQQYLGDKGSIYNVVDRIRRGDEKAYKELKTAQLEAEKAQVLGTYASQGYSSQKKYDEALNNYTNTHYNNTGDIFAGIGMAAGGATLGAGLGVAGGLLAAGAANAWNPVGWVLLLGAAGIALGAAIGGTAAANYVGAKTEEGESQVARQSIFNTKSIQERIDIVGADLKKAEEAGDSELVDKCNVLIASLKEQQATINQINDQMNQITLQEALLNATFTNGSGEHYLAEMSVAALKTAGIDSIVDAFARSIENNGGLQGLELFDADGNLTEAGYNYALNKLKQQGDEEINAVLAGDSYTLSEILKLRNKYGDERWIMAIMQNFATALNIPLEMLEQYAAIYGELKYSEVLMSPNELRETLGGYTELLSEITTGTGKVSEWMEKIISQYPELIAYMNDHEELFSRISTKMVELSNVYLQAQYSDMISSADFFNTIKDALYGKLSKKEVAALEDFGVESVSSILDWMKQQYDEDGNLQGAGKAVMDALQETVDEFGVQVTSNILKQYYDMIIDFKTKTLDKEIDNLKEQKETLQQINTEREYENKLIEAKLKLENASKDKRRVYRAGIGWVYESNQDEIRKAQDELDSLSNQKTIAELELEIAQLEADKEALQKLEENKNYETLQEFYNTFVKDYGLEGKSFGAILENISSGLNGISKNLSSMIKEDSDTAGSEKAKALTNLKQAWTTLSNATPGTAAYNTALENYHIAWSNATKYGVTESDVAKWGTVPVSATEGAAGQTAKEVGEGDINTQKASPNLRFKLNDTNTPSQHFEGTTSLAQEAYSRADVLGWVLKDIGNNNAWVWLPGGAGFKPRDDVRFTKSENDETLLDYINRIKANYGIDEYVLTAYDGGNESLYVKGGVPYLLTGTSTANGMDIVKGSVDPKSNIFAEQAYARGTLNSGFGYSWVNEFGTEAIVTPWGTLTTLPSHSGVVPADITKNLWELGELAPMIQKQLMGYASIDMGQRRSYGDDNSFNIGVLNMSVKADESFDVDSFVNAIKTEVALSKNNR